jgi:Tfp pilus assembly protein PilF
MSNSGTFSLDAALQQAVASHKAGQRAAAVKAYQAVLAAEPGHAGANHNLGVLMVQAGQIEQGLAHLKAALEANSREGLYWFSYAKGLLAAGDAAEAEAVLGRARQHGFADKRFEALQTQIQALPKNAAAGPDSPVAAERACRKALAEKPDDEASLDGLGNALLAQGRIDEAIQSYRKAVAAAPHFAQAHYHLGSVLSENGHIREGFEHYMRRAALVYGAGKAPPADQPDPPHKVKHDLEQRDYLAGGKAPPDAPLVPDMFRLADGSRLDGPAVNPANATGGLLDDWRRSNPQMVVIENFLTTPALEKLRAYCAGSTVWRKLYSAGYLGAAPEDGFACPLLAQIVEEIQATYRSILNGEKFRYLGAFKYDSDLCSGTNTHADNSIINVNFYIAPDEANLDPEHGGMEIWDLAAPSLADMRKYNSNESAIRDLLKRSGAKRTVIPHRANRAVIFKSTLFHKTDAFKFKSDYLSRRINVSLLFGQFG